MIKRNLFANYVGQGWSAVVGLAFIPIYVRFMGVEAYGLVGVFAMLYAWCTLLDLGMSPALGREMARFTAGAHTPESIWRLLRSLELVMFAVAAAILLIFLLSARWMATEWLNVKSLPVSSVVSALSLIAVVLAMRFCETLYRSALLGLQRQVWFNAVNTALNTVRHGGAALIVAFVSPTVTAFFLWQLLISIATIAIFAGKLYATLPRPERRPGFSVAALREVWAFAGGMMGLTLLSVVLTQADKVALSKLLTLDVYGIYTLAWTVATTLQFLVNPITQALYPRLVQAHTADDEAAFSKIYHGGAQLVTFATAPSAFALAFFAKPIIFAWSGDTVLAAHVAPILVPLSLGLLANCLLWMPYQAQLAYAWTGLAIRVYAVAIVAELGLIAILAPRYGVHGVAWIWPFLNVAIVAAIVIGMHARVLPGQALRWLSRDVLPMLAVPAVLALALRLTLPWEHASRFGLVVMLGLVGLVLYVAGGLVTPALAPLRQAALRRLSV